MKKYTILFLVSSLFLLSFFSFLYFFESGKHLAPGDGVSRMNISRKVTDNLNPGLAQLGNVWLPLPQILMIPFVMNSFLWHSGIGGAIVSMISYIIGGIFIYKTAKLITSSTISSIVAVSVFALNINILYFQSTAMSESSFVCFLAGAIYYFSKWIKLSEKMYLIPAAVFVSCITLIRYEALSILFSSIPMVFIYTYLKTKNYHRAESNTVLYSVLACLGFGLWTLYLATIFGDPLYWKNFYASSELRETSSGLVSGYTQNLSWIEASWKYLTSVVWMNGLVPTSLSILAIPILLIKSIKEKSYYFLPLLISSAIFVFMVLTLMRNTPISQPDLNISNFLSGATSQFNEFNIRYGILLLPMISLLVAYVFSYKIIIFRLLILVLLFFQVYSYFYPNYSLIYQYPMRISETEEIRASSEGRMVTWLSANYDSGLIMISALKHDPAMFRLGFDYKIYIHEGAGTYWLDSIKKPQKYAKWIVMDEWNSNDQVTKFLKDSPSLEKYYDVVYEDRGIFVYKIKTQTEVPFETIISM